MFHFIQPITSSMCVVCLVTLYLACDQLVHTSKTTVLHSRAPKQEIKNDLKSGLIQVSTTLSGQQFITTPNTQTISETDNTLFQTNDSPCTIVSLTANCSGLGLVDVHSTWFPNRTETLLLNNNLIKKLTKSFSHLANLTSLDLSENVISIIELNAFEGLHNLKSLSLFNNRLNFTDSNSFKDIFKPVIYLQELNIIQNYLYTAGMHSFIFLEPLTKLRSLSLGCDVETLYFGEEFREMSNLSVLRISGNIKIINNSSFTNVAGLSELCVESLDNLHNISQGAFLPLAKLRVLKMFQLPMSTQYVLSLLEPFEGRNMTEIKLDTVSSTHTRSDPRIEGYITYRDTKHLLDICLETLTLINCRIYYLALDAFQHVDIWNKCLKNLYISHNTILGTFTALSRLLKLASLRMLTLNNFKRPCFQVSDFPHSISTVLRNEGTCPPSDELLYNPAITSLLNTNIQTYLSVRPFVDIGYECNKKAIEVMTISESIKYINFKRSSNSQGMMCKYEISGAQNVDYMDFSESGLSNFTGSLKGFISMRTLIVSGNNVNVLNESYLDTFPALENLALANCQLDREFMSIHSGRLFQNLTRLQQLDLSSNLLNYLSTDTFMYNKHLKWLTLAQNQFREIPFSLKYTPELEVLDLRQNSLNTIDMQKAHELDILVSRSGQFQLLLDGNLLTCGCTDLHFLQWMRLTSVTFDQNGNYTCLNNKGERTHTLLYPELGALWRECWGIFFLNMAVILMCFYLIGSFVTFILIKNEKFIASYFLQLIGNFKQHTKEDYPIGVYIGYSDRDYLFPCTDLREFIENSLRLKTFLIDRDLIASVDKASGIVDALNASWRILLVCSESFLKEDDWSMFTMRSAIYTQSPANPARVIILVHKDCLPLLPPALLSSVNDENICVVSEWAMNYEMMQMLTTRLT
ncbi:toll-like receptor 4 [Biomphalaria glabrata]|uniref:Toll-like receptor 4 n=1 Tax=Biomphalaria glabrata TaxID=6526 RepID=A0A9W2YXG2_BIOGL|nr:toll-like receptor 4 [Biomphalaria glabrata]